MKCSLHSKISCFVYANFYLSSLKPEPKLWRESGINTDRLIIVLSKALSIALHFYSASMSPWSGCVWWGGLWKFQ